MIVILVTPWKNNKPTKITNTDNTVSTIQKNLVKAPNLDLSNSSYVEPAYFK